MAKSKIEECKSAVSRAEEAHKATVEPLDVARKALDDAERAYVVEQTAVNGKRLNAARDACHLEEVKEKHAARTVDAARAELAAAEEEQRAEEQRAEARAAELARAAEVRRLAELRRTIGWEACASEASPSIDRLLDAVRAVNVAAQELAEVARAQASRHVEAAALAEKHDDDPPPPPPSLAFERVCLLASMRAQGEGAAPSEAARLVLAGLKDRTRRDLAIGAYWAFGGPPHNMALGLGGYLPENLSHVGPDDILASILATGSTSELNTNARLAEYRRERHRIERGNPVERGQQAGALLNQYRWALSPEERAHLEELERRGQRAAEELNAAFAAAQMEHMRNPPPRPPSEGLPHSSDDGKFTRERFEREFWSTYSTTS